MRGQPPLDSAMRRVLQCWHELHGDRYQGNSGGAAIPGTAVIRWCRSKRLDPDFAAALATVIVRMDQDRAERIASERSLR